MKRCNKCFGEFELPSVYFHKNPCRKDGLDGTCKACKAAYEKTRVRKKVDSAARYRDDKWKFEARAKAKWQYREQSFKCSVLNCSEAGVNLHHVNYDLPLDVVPLCRKHHEAEHSRSLAETKAQS